MKILSLHVDTTGTDFVLDRIIRISTVCNEFGDAISSHTVKEYIIRPDRAVQIPAEVVEKTGINSDVIDSCGVPFSDVAADILSQINGADAIVAFRARLHINFLQCAFDRLAMDPHFENHSIIDPYIIEVNTNSHALDAVYERAFGEQGADANPAEKSLRVFCDHQMKTIAKEDIKRFRDPDDVQHYPDGWVNMRDGVLTFIKGQYRDQRVSDIIARDPGYIKWLCVENIVSMPTRRAFKDILEDMKRGC